VLANEEVIGGLSERGNHPVVRISPAANGCCASPAYADLLEKDLETLDWSESIKGPATQMDRAAATGAEVDFFIGRGEQNAQGKPSPVEFKAWKSARTQSGFPTHARR